MESENLSSVGEEHRQNVEGFPTIVCLNKGKPVSKYQGPRTSNDIDSFARDNYTSINGVTNAATNLNTILRSAKTSKGKGKSKSKSKGPGKGKKTKMIKKKVVKSSQKTNQGKKASSK